MIPDENFNKDLEQAEKKKLAGVVQELSDTQKQDIFVKGLKMIFTMCYWYD